MAWAFSIAVGFGDGTRGGVTMRIEINGQVEGSVHGSTVESGSLALVLTRLRREALAARRVVSHLFLDGELLTEAREQAFAEHPASGFSRLEVTLCDSADFVPRLLEGVLETLDKLAGAANDAAQQVRTGADVRSRIAPIADGLLFVLDACRESLRYLAGTGCAVPPPHHFARKIEPALGEILGGLEARDGVRLADGLEHELIPVLREFSSEVDELIRCIQPGLLAAAGIGIGRGTGRGTGEI